MVRAGSKGCAHSQEVALRLALGRRNRERRPWKSEPHELDKARWGLGKQELPKRVLSIGGRLGYIDNGDVANSQVTFYEWDDALLISDVRGLDIKSKVTFGLKGVNPCP